MNTLKMTREQYETRREIERFPECPALSEDEIRVITGTLFIASNPQQSDVLFVFGSSYGDKWHEVVELYKRGFAPIVYIAGGIGDKSFETGRILSHMIRDEFTALGVPSSAIVVDERSKNTLEDVIYARELFEARNIPHQRILFACKAPHSGRCLRTLKKVFPESELFCFAYEFCHEGRTITAENWPHEEFSKRGVWGEYQRIKLYSSRGDICE